MAHGLNTVLRRPTAVGCKTESKGGLGSRRIFAPHFKLQVLDSYRSDTDCKGNQRATARKYGIHRRQIQKWLQCENNLRNSVGKVKSVSLEARKCGPEVSLRSGQHRQQDDFSTDAYSQILPEQNVTCTDANIRCSPRNEVLCFQDETRVPFKSNNEALFNAPLDYTMHCRSRSVSPTETGVPMDLSLKGTPPQNVTSPVYCSLSPHTTLISSATSSPSTNMCSESEIWDLSTKHQKYSEFTNIISPTVENPPKPVKLFKPYLDDLEQEYAENKLKVAQTPLCCNGFVAPQPENDAQFYNNNYIAADYTYTLHELQPKKAVNYYYTVNKNYICTPQCETVPFCSTAYDNAGYLQPLSPSIKHKQCYSLDFKVSAIECYYQDAMAHESEQPITTKLNIHQDHFPKWLKREDTLYIHNDANKFMHVVR